MDFTNEGKNTSMDLSFFISESSVVTDISLKWQILNRQHHFLENILHTPHPSPQFETI